MGGHLDVSGSDTRTSAVGRSDVTSVADLVDHVRSELHALLAELQPLVDEHRTRCHSTVVLQTRSPPCAYAEAMLSWKTSIGHAEVERCEKDGCGGAQLYGGHCLEHLTGDEFAAALVRLRRGEPLNAHGTTISSERLEALCDALEEEIDWREQPIVMPGAMFSGDVDFRKATFSGDVDFDCATFSSNADFRGATFSGDAQFGAGFKFAIFRGATFSGDAHFNRAVFETAPFGPRSQS